MKEQMRGVQDCTARHHNGSNQVSARGIDARNYTPGGHDILCGKKSKDLEVSMKLRNAVAAAAILASLLLLVPPPTIAGKDSGDVDS
jgi:hypothetical protein